MFLRQMRLYALLLLIAFVLTAMMIIMFDSNSLVSVEREFILRKRSSVPCNSSLSALKLVQCASSPNECILENFVCDVVIDCSDQSDESNATCIGTPACDEQVDEQCLNNGSCVSHPRSATRVAYHTCDCTAAYTGDDCGMPVPTITPTSTTIGTTEGVVSSTMDGLSPATVAALTTIGDGSSLPTPQNAVTVTLTSSAIGTTSSDDATTDGIFSRTTATRSSIATTINVAEISTAASETVTPSAAASSSFGTTTLELTSESTAPPAATITPTTVTEQTMTPILNSSPPTSSARSTLSSLPTSANVLTNGVTTTRSNTHAPLGTDSTEVIPRSITTARMAAELTTTAELPSITTARLVTQNTASFACGAVDSIFSVVRCATPNECIINIFVCDGISDCRDGSDESLATCQGEPACDYAPGVCENGGTCLSIPLTSQRVAHFTCLCAPGFTGDRCREEAPSTTSLWTSTILQTSQPDVSTVGNTPAVTDGERDTRLSTLLATTQADTTMRGTVISESEATSIPTTTDIQISSESHPTKGITTEIPATSLSDVGYTSSRDATTRDVMTVTEDLPTSTLTVVIIETETSTDVSSTHKDVTISFTSAPPLSTEREASTFSAPITTDVFTSTEDRVAMETEMVTERLTTDHANLRTTAETELGTVVATEFEFVTTGKAFSTSSNTGSTTDETSVTDLSIVTTEMLNPVPTQDALEIYPTTEAVPTGTEALAVTFSTSTTTEEIMELTITEEYLSTEQTITSTMPVFTNTVDRSTNIATDSTSGIVTSPEVFSTPMGPMTITNSQDSSAATNAVTTAVTFSEPIPTTDIIATGEILGTAVPLTESSFIDVDHSSASIFTSTTLSSWAGTKHAETIETTEGTVTRSDTTHTNTQGSDYTTTLQVTHFTEERTGHVPSSGGTTPTRVSKTTAESGFPTTLLRTSSKSYQSITTEKDSSSSITKSSDATTGSSSTPTGSSETTPDDGEQTTRTLSTETSYSPTRTSTSHSTTNTSFSTTTGIRTIFKESSTITTQTSSTQTGPSETTPKHVEQTARTLTTETPHSPTKTSTSPSTTNTTISTATGNRTATSDEVVLVVLSSTAGVVLALIAFLIIVGCCIARRGRKSNLYQGDQTPLRSLETYSRQSNYGTEYSIDRFENSKPSFVHRLRPLQHSKLYDDSDMKELSLDFPPSSTLSIINEYFEQMHNVRNGQDDIQDIHGTHNDAYEKNHNWAREEVQNMDWQNDLGSESFEMRFFPETEYWTPSSASEIEEMPYYITDDAPLPVTHV